MKTQINRTPEEKRILKTIIHELKFQWIQLVDATKIVKEKIETGIEFDSNAECRRWLAFHKIETLYDIMSIAFNIDTRTMWKNALDYVTK